MRTGRCWMKTIGLLAISKDIKVHDPINITIPDIGMDDIRYLGLESHNATADMKDLPYYFVMLPGINIPVRIANRHQAHDFLGDDFRIYTIKRLMED